MLAKVREFIESHRMLAHGDRVIIAVSGGPDSVALLHVLHRLTPEFSLHLHLFHLDHGLRGVASAEDAAYVQRLADRLAMPATVVRLEPGRLKGLPGSLQANARAIRYQEMEALAARIGANRVALGHQRDDQAETVLMRLLRGAGPHGLAGIPPVRTADLVTYIRPLLGISRDQIDNYCREAELFPRLDSSNLGPDYLRNRIRLTLLPQLAREYNPAIAANLAQTAAIFRDEDQLLDQLAAQAVARCRVPGEGSALLGSVLRAEPVAIARRVVRLAAQAVVGPAFELGLEAVDEVLKGLAKPAGSRRLDLPGGLQALFAYDRLRFTATHGDHDVQQDCEWPVALQGETILPELSMRVEATHGEWHTIANPFEAAFDLDGLPGSLAVRYRRPGDRLWPVGMEGSKKLQDILVDAKVPLAQRDRLPILVSGGEILWVIGYRLDRRFLATATSTRVLHLRVTGWDGPN